MIQTALASTAVRALCLSLVLLAAITPLRLEAEELDPASLAEKAIAVRYEAESLAYEKKQAEQTVNGSKRTIESTQKSLPALQKTVEGLTAEKTTAEAELQKQADLAEAAKTNAEKSGQDEHKKLAEAAEKKRVDAERAFKLAESKWKREADRLERTRQQLKDRKSQLAAALKAIPEKDAASKKTSEQADALSADVQQTNREYAATQYPLGVAWQIDDLVASGLAKAKIPASPQASDEEFLRRATLDITGRVPKYEDVQSFLEDKGADKRSALVNRLLSDNGYGQNFSQRFCTVTTENGTTTLNQGQDYFNDWLAESLQLNRRWDRIATDMLASAGAGYQQPGALFTVAYRMNEQPDPALLLAAAGDHFLGLQIKCAQCHDHPFHEWTQNEFWGMAAMFGRVRLKGQTNNGRELEHLVTDDDVDLKEMVRMNGIKYPEQLPGGKILIPDPVDPDKTLGTVTASYLGGDEPKLPEKGNYRGDFAGWVTSKQNPYFARATVNRLWSHFFGRGLVEPIDNLHPDFPPTHPKVLDLLATEFRDSDFDLQYLIRIIAATKAYQRTSKPIEGNADDKELLSHMAVKPLDSFALVDSLWVVLRRTPPEASRRRDAAAVFDTRLPGGDPQKYTHSIPQVLKMMNNRDHVGTNSSTVQLATQGKPAAEAIANLYLAVLARRPSTEESGEMLAYAKALDNDRQAYADIFWVLLNSAEFLINH